LINIISLLLQEIRETVTQPNLCPFLLTVYKIYLRLA
jgi:hypothetical protein